MSTCSPLKSVATAAAAVALASVPERMFLSSSMKTAKLGQAALVSLSFDKESKSVKENTVITGEEAIKKHTGKFGSVCFVVRRPG
mmetsp:Transcript_21684/g.30399  ORF Transcript_21684/g.30399 Transcript_21684/m.30399 type:complete len:85 (+) Transcript_21684:19-273(+)